MSSLFRSTINTRFVPGQERFIRSDLPCKLTEEDKQWLLSKGFTRAIDLRNEDEYTKWPSSFEGDERFTLYHKPLAIMGDSVKTMEDMTKSYRMMLDNRLTDVLDIILSKGKTIYFCYTGKDRTGAVTAMLMKRLGYSEAAIIDDYMESKRNMEQIIIEHCKRHPEDNIDICMPNIKFLQPVLDSKVL